METVLWFVAVWAVSWWLVGGMYYTDFVRNYDPLYRTAGERNALRSEAAVFGLLFGPCGFPTVLFNFGGFEPLWFIPEDYKQDHKQDDEPFHVRLANDLAAQNRASNSSKESL